MQKLKSGDKVVVLAGKDKGREGSVLKIISRPGSSLDPKSNLRVLVEGVNIIKKHVKGNPSQEKPGGIIEKEAPIHISNVAILNPETNKADKVGFKTLENGKKVRYFKSNGEVLDG